MKKTIIFLCFVCLSFKILIIPAMANTQILKKGFYKAGDINLSPDTVYTVQNNSYSERMYILIFDASAGQLQGIRLKPQSQKYNLVPLQPQYKIVLIGEGEVVIS